jgi:hypothetical protein
MADKIAGMFKPVCYQTGKCEFKANFDRACSIRDRVDYNEATGIKPEKWETGNYPGTNFRPIKPGEWLLDPSAARKKA